MLIHINKNNFSLEGWAFCLILKYMMVLTYLDLTKPMLLGEFMMVISFCV
jgi:hypothetical protein